MIRTILTYPNPELKKKSAPVTIITDSIRELVQDMAETMYDAPGVGLAAPQIGVHQRVIVIDISGKDEPHDLIIAINPVIVHAEGEILRRGGVSLGARLCRQCQTPCPCDRQGARPRTETSTPGKRKICWPSRSSTKSTIWTASSLSTTSRRSSVTCSSAKPAKRQRRSDDRLAHHFHGYTRICLPHPAEADRARRKSGGGGHPAGPAQRDAARS